MVLYVRHCAQELTPVALICVSVCLLTCEWASAALNSSKCLMHEFYLFIYTWIMWFSVVPTRFSTCCKTSWGVTLVHVVLVFPNEPSQIMVTNRSPVMLMFCIDLKYARLVSRFLWYVQGQIRLFVCRWKLRIEKRATSLRQMHFLRRLASLLGSKCLQQPERHLEHTSFSIITQLKLVWQPAS